MLVHHWDFFNLPFKDNSLNIANLKSLKNSIIRNRFNANNHKSSPFSPNIKNVLIYDIEPIHNYPIMARTPWVACQNSWTKEISTKSNKRNIILSQCSPNNTEKRSKDTRNFIYKIWTPTTTRSFNSKTSIRRSLIQACIYPIEITINTLNTFPNKPTPLKFKWKRTLLDPKCWTMLMN